MENKLTTYDFLAYLVPGSVVTLLGYYYAVASDSTIADTIGGGTFAATALVITSFIVGHFLQAMSTGWVEDPAHPCRTKEVVQPLSTGVCSRSGIILTESNSACYLTCIWTT